MNNKEILYAACRNDLYAFMQKAFYEIDNSQPFKGNWHLELICDTLQQCLDGKNRLLIINIPPRNLKSHIVSISFPAYILGHSPSERIICASYAQPLANDLSRKTRQLMETDFYKQVFKTRLGDKNTENMFETTYNGYRFATSVDGSLTGFGGNWIILDDPIKADDAQSDVKRNNVNNWYDNTLISRLNDKVNGVIIVVMQRLHIDDLTGHLLKQDGWDLLSLPAIAEHDESFTLSNGKIVGRKVGEALNPDLEPLEILKNQQKLMSNYNFSAQYQQNPIPAKGNVINFDDLRFFDSLPNTGIVFQSWDIALKDGKDNDYSVCITAKYQNNLLYIDNVQRFKLDMFALANQMQEMYQNFKCNHLIVEDSSISTHLLQYIQGKLNLYPIKYKPQADKITRANNASLFISSGRVLLRRNAAWLDDFKSEINAFPNGKHDDQVDALTQLIGVINNKQNYCNLEAIANAIQRYDQKTNNMSKAKFCEMAYKKFRPRFHFSMSYKKLS